MYQGNDRGPGGTVTAMGTRFEHSVDYPFSTGRLWELVSAENYWTDLLKAINGDLGVLEEFTRKGDAVTVAMTQVVPEDKLPSIVTTVRGGDLKIPRRIVLSYAGGIITGDTTASVSGVSAGIKATQSSSGEKASTLYRGEIKVSLPFVGGKIEKVVKDQIVDLFNGERDETVEWERRGGA